MRRTILFLIVCFTLFFAVQGLIPLANSLSMDIVTGILLGSSATLLITALFINLCLFLLIALRWRLMLPPNLMISLRELVLNRLAGFSVSYLTPGNQIGGEPLQIALLGKRKNINAKQAMEAVLLERGVDFLANGFLISLFTILFGRELISLLNWSSASFLLILLIAAVVGFALWYAKDKVDWPNIRKRFGKSMLIRLTIYSILIWLLFLLEFWLLFAAVGLYLPATQLILLLLAVRFAFWLPMPIPAAGGTMEASLIMAASLFSVAPADALSVVILVRLRDLFFIAIGLIWFWIESGRWVFSAFSKPLSADGGVEFE